MHEAVSVQEPMPQKVGAEYEYIVTIKTLFFIRHKRFTASTINGAIVKAMKRHRLSSVEAAERVYK